MKLFALAALVAGCDVPPPTVHLRFAGPPTQMCPSVDCAQIALTCNSMMSIRIADPDDTTAPYLSQCSKVEFDKKKDACSLAHVTLEDKPIPVRPLEVQIAVYPLVVDTMGNPVCPAKVQYDRVWGFPVEQQDTVPALGGRAFYQPGDNQIVVTLGCTDITQLTAAGCVTTPSTPITAAVDDFETIGFAVGNNIDLHVFVGEPSASGSVYTLPANATRELTRSVHGATQSWAGDVDLSFASYVCLEVLESVPQATSVLRCRAANAAMKSYDLPGVYLSRTALGEILSALNMTAFPDAGITIGIVVDESGNPLDTHTVSLQPAGTVKYLSNDRKSVIAGGVTSKSGVFVSTDAPFGTQFSTSESGHGAVSAIGGLVSGKVTLVVLQRDVGTTM